MRTGGVGGTRAGAGRLGNVAVAAGLALLLLVGLTGCGPDEEAPEAHSEPTEPDAATSEDEASTTTEPDRAETPPTSYAPDTVEGEIEAAYLQSWQTFEDAIIEADPDLLQQSFTGEALEVLTAQVDELIANGESARIEIEHDYEISPASDTTASLIDVQINHSVLLDRESGEPLEADPEEQVLRTYTLALVEDRWLVDGLFREPPQD